jgi:hypothetical protein
MIFASSLLVTRALLFPTKKRTLFSQLSLSEPTIITHTKKHWARSVISRSIISESSCYILVDHIWAGLTITHTREHWARSVIPGSVIPDLDRLNLIRKSIKPDQAYLISIDSISFEEASSPIDHIWTRPARSYSRKHWARSVISRSIISESDWLSLIRESTEFDQSSLDRLYLSRIDYHSFEEASSSIDHIWSRSTRSHSKEHWAQLVIPRSIISELSWLSLIRRSIKFDRSYLISVGSISFKEASSSIDYIWSRSTRSHSKKHQVRSIISDLDRLDLIRESISLSYIYSDIVDDSDTVTHTLFIKSDFWESVASRR